MRAIDKKKIYKFIQNSSIFTALNDQNVIGIRSLTQLVRKQSVYKDVHGKYIKYVHGIMIRSCMLKGYYTADFNKENGADYILACTRIQYTENDKSTNSDINC